MVIMGFGASEPIAIWPPAGGDNYSLFLSVKGQGTTATSMITQATLAYIKNLEFKVCKMKLPV